MNIISVLCSCVRIYDKFHQLRQHRLLGTRDSHHGASASALPQQSRGAGVEMVALEQDSINNAPVDLHFSAKRLTEELEELIEQNPNPEDDAPELTCQPCKEPEIVPCIYCGLDFKKGVDKGWSRYNGHFECGSLDSKAKYALKDDDEFSKEFKILQGKKGTPDYTSIMGQVKNGKTGTLKKFDENQLSILKRGLTSFIQRT